MESDVAEECVGVASTKVVVVDQHDVLEVTSEEFSDGNSIVLRPGPDVRLKLSQRCLLGAVKLNRVFDGHVEVGVESDGVHFALPVAPEVEFEDGVRCDRVREVNGFPAVPSNFDVGAIGGDEHSTGRVLRAAIGLKPDVLKIENTVFGCSLRDGYGLLAIVESDVPEHRVSVGFTDIVVVDENQISEVTSEKLADGNPVVL